MRHKQIAFFAVLAVSLGISLETLPHITDMPRLTLRKALTSGDSDGLPVGESALDNRLRRER